MSDADRERWERKHEASHDSPARPSLEWLPDPGDSPGIAVDVACGQGRHARALIAAGYRVVGVDIARTALTKAAARCARRPGRFIPVQVDLDTWPFRPRCLDLIVQIDYLARALFEDMKASTRPGGLILIDTFTAATARCNRGPSNPDFLLEDGELEKVFSDWEILTAEAAAQPVPRAAVLARRPL